MSRTRSFLSGTYLIALAIAVFAVIFSTASNTPVFAGEDPNTTDKNSSDVKWADSLSDVNARLYVGMTHDEFLMLIRKYGLYTRTNPPDVNECVGNDGRPCERWTWEDPPSGDTMDHPASEGSSHLAVDLQDGKVSSVMYWSRRPSPDDSHSNGQVGMGNPASWNDVDKTINDAIEEHKKLSAHPGWCGLSLPVFIAKRLAEKGYLKPASEWPKENK